MDKVPKKASGAPARKKRKAPKKARRNPAGIGKELLVNSAAILGGMVAATQVAKLADQYMPGGDTIRKVGSVAIPLVLGGLTASMTKSNIGKYAGVGMAAAGVSVGVRHVMPSLAFLPLSGQIADMMPFQELPAPTAPIAPHLRLAPVQLSDRDDSGYLADSGFLEDDIQAVAV